MAKTAAEALECQLEMIEHRGWKIKLLSIERKCPWANKWIDESEILNETQVTTDE